MTVRFNPFSADFRRDPYPVYAALREDKPVHKTLGMWVLTRYADVRAVLLDRGFSAGLIPRLVSQQADRVSGEDVARIERLGRKSLVFTDNPEHARLRGLVNRVFTAPAVAKLRRLVTTIAGDLVDKALANGGMDAIADFAAPLPVAVLCEWMALPSGLREHVTQWTHDIRFLLEPGLMKREDFTRVAAVTERFAHALDAVVAARRDQPGEDLVSQLLAARTGGGDRLRDEEVVFVCIMCFVAGNETTKALIGNGILALLRHGARPEPAKAAVGEALRYDSPLQLTKRLATRDTEIGGTTIRAGEQVLLCLGAANRDPAVFGDPDTFDPGRDTTGHLAFGYGMHGCLGGLLAGLQAETAFETLFRHEVALRKQPLEWQDHSFIVRGLARLPVSVRSAA
ncbi:cytochrome P450 [Amycolatopsis acididurans]|nr:cytochrome P450 [Amycolatopsis acididurans]